MAAYDFKFVVDNGHIFYVCAPSRKEAIKLFREEHGVSDAFIKEHTVITNCGKVV